MTPEQKHEKRITRLLEKGKNPWNSLRLGTIRQRLKSRYQLLRRLECADANGMVQCCTCDKWGKWNDGFHGGHWIHGTSPSLLLRPNVNPQCAQCNTYANVGDAYDQFMNERYDEHTKAIITAAKRCKHQWTRREMAELFVHWGELIKKEKQRLGVS